MRIVSILSIDPLFADRLETALRVRQSRVLGETYWALGSRRRSLFGWFVLCSVGASRRCYLGMSNSHLLLSWAGSGCCDTTPDIGQTQLHLSLLRRESRAAVLPPPLVLLDNEQNVVHLAFLVLTKLVLLSFSPMKLILRATIEANQEKATRIIKN